jgi:hypothetical protein
VLADTEVEGEPRVEQLDSAGNVASFQEDLQGGNSKIDGKLVNAKIFLNFNIKFSWEKN